MDIDKNFLVEKSKALIWTKFSEYSLFEMRLIETYLARINARDEDTSEVTFTLNEYLRLLGYAEPEKVTSKRVEKSLYSFLNAKIKIDLNNDGDYRLVNLFSDACVINSNPAFEKRTITIDCNPKLKKAFFGIAERGYIGYRLDLSLQLKSKYSIRLYSLLKDNLYRNEWRVELKELRELIGATNKNNESFREFNKVLIKCTEEISEVTDLVVTFEKISKGRLTRGIVFKIKKKFEKETSQVPGQMNVYDYPELLPDEDDKDLPGNERSIYHEALPEGFTDEQVELIRQYAVKRVPYGDHGALPYECVVADYIRSKTALMLEYSKRKPVNEPFHWIRKAVDEDWK